MSAGRRLSNPPLAEPVLAWLTPASATLRAQAREKRDAYGPPLSLQKDTSQDKEAGHPGSQTPGLFFSPPWGQSTHDFPCYWDLQQLCNILSQMLQPSTPINVDLNLVSTLHADPHCLQHSVFPTTVPIPAPKFYPKPKCQYYILFPV